MNNIYILNEAALDETIITNCLHFSMQKIEQSRGLGRASRWVTSTTTNKFLCFFVFHVLPRRYVHDFRSLAVPTPPLQIKYFIIQG